MKYGSFKGAKKMDEWMVKGDKQKGGKEEERKEGRKEGRKKGCQYINSLGGPGYTEHLG